MPPGPEPPGRPGRRIALVDAARGTALLGMFAYHLTWDLGFYQFLDGSVPLSAPLKLYAHSVASAFLLLAGISLVLAERAGVSLAHRLRRLAVVGAAAAAVTLASLYFLPDRFIFFGILHCIALSSLIGLAFVRAPLWLAGLAAILCLAAPAVIAAPALDAPPFWWLGLGTYPPPTLDYRPLFPWLGVVLAGVVAARIGLASAGEGAWSHWSPKAVGPRLLAWGGRHSLPIYLVHQPIFLALLFVAAQLVGARPDSAGATFERACQMRCADAGADASICTPACSCLTARLKDSGLWSGALADRLTADQRTEIGRLALVCGAEPGAAGEPPRRP